MNSESDWRILMSKTVVSKSCDHGDGNVSWLTVTEFPHYNKAMISIIDKKSDEVTRSQHFLLDQDSASDVANALNHIVWVNAENTTIQNEGITPPELGELPGAFAIKPKIGIGFPVPQFVTIEKIEDGNLHFVSSGKQYMVPSSDFLMIMRLDYKDEEGGEI